MEAICGDFRVSTPLAAYPTPPLRTRTSFPPSKVDWSGFLDGRSIVSVVTPKGSRDFLDGKHLHGHCRRRQAVGVFGDNNISPKSISQEVDTLLLNAIHMSFFERLNLAWKIIFPSATTRRNSNALIAKQRLKMILFSDRCAVSDEAKQKIVHSIVSTLSDFVEIESQDKVQLSVSTEPEIGTIYSVTVPVRRVKPEYLDEDEVIEYKDTRETSGAVDVNFDFYIPNENFNES